MKKPRKLKTIIQSKFGHNLKWLKSDFNIYVTDKNNRKNMIKVSNVYKCIICNNEFFIGVGKSSRKNNFGFNNLIDIKLAASSFRCMNLIIKDILE